MPLEAPSKPAGARTQGTRCDRAARTILRSTFDIWDTIREKPRQAWDTVMGRAAPVTSWARRLGPGGEEAARQIQRVSDDADKVRGWLMVRLDRLSRLPKAAQRDAARAHYYGDVNPEELTGAAREAYDILAEPFDRLLRSAQHVEAQRTMPDGTRLPVEGTGKGYPTVLSDKGRRIAKDAHADRRTADGVEAAVEIVARNHGQVRDLTRDMSPEDLRRAKQVALGHTPENASDAVIRAGEAMAENVEWGLARLREFHENAIRGVDPYFERTRVEMPEDMLDFNPQRALPDFFGKQSLMLSAWRQWGYDLSGWKAVLGRVGQEAGNQRADLLGGYVSTALGKPPGGNPAETALLDVARDYQMFRIFGGTIIGPLRNAGQPFTNGADQPISAWIRSLKELPPFVHRWVEGARELREAVIESGANPSLNPLTVTSDRVTGRVAQRAGVVHHTVIPENNYRAAVIGKLGAEENIRRLVQMQGESGPLARAALSLRHLALDPEAATARALQRQGIDPERIQQIRQRAQDATPEELQRLIDSPTEALSHDDWLTVMRRSSLDTQFGYTFASRHVFSGQSPSWSAFYMLKNWGVRQLGYIHDHVLSEAAKGNGKPLVKFLATTFFLGEVYNNAQDVARGSERSVRSRVQAGRTDAQSVGYATLRNIADGGGVGILFDVMWGFGSVAFGPMAGTASNATRAGVHMLQDPEQTPTAIKDFLDREFVVTAQARGLWNRVRAANEEKHQRFFDYGTWRDRSFNHLTQRDAPTPGARLQQEALSAVTGPVRHFPTERTLTYEQAAKRVTGNDIEGAAEYIERLLRTAEDNDERQSILQGLQAAGRQRSPLGPIPEAERRDFLATFDGEERANARRLQREWERDWDRAVRMGQQRARRQ